MLLYEAVTANIVVGLDEYLLNILFYKDKTIGLTPYTYSVAGYTWIGLYGTDSAAE